MLINVDHQQRQQWAGLAAKMPRRHRSSHVRPFDRQVVFIYFSGKQKRDRLDETDYWALSITTGGGSFKEKKKKKKNPNIPKPITVCTASMFISF